MIFPPLPQCDAVQRLACGGRGAGRGSAARGGAGGGAVWCGTRGAVVRGWSVQVCGAALSNPS